jgi:hypothetical protein
MFGWVLNRSSSAQLEAGRSVVTAPGPGNNTYHHASAPGRDPASRTTRVQRGFSNRARAR